MPRFILACVVLFLFTAAATAADPLAGRWSGYWSSDSNGHRGPLRATVFPSPTGYDVRFSGRFAHVIPFVYRQHLGAVGTSGDAVILSAERRIPLFGTFRTDAVVTPTHFDATFRSGKDRGRVRALKVDGCAMPDRESFIAAIAANPEDDLPRLVFADWLDENGEPERAEFIRVQIEANIEADPERRKVLNQAAADAFEAHGERWYTPLVSALGIDLREYKPTPIDAKWQQVAGGYLPLVLKSGRGIAFAMHFAYQRGFVDELSLIAAFRPADCSLAEAFRHEPVHALDVYFRNESEAENWTRLTDPALRRVRRLRASFHPAEAKPVPPVLREVFDDPHLAGVRHFLLSSAPPGISEGRLHPDTMRRFAESPLAYRLDALTLDMLDDDGLRRLGQHGRFRLSKLKLWGSFSHSAPSHFEHAGFPHTVSSLSLGSDQFGDTGVTRLVRGNWEKLAELGLVECGITDAGLHALAAAEFTPHLEVLDLSDNRLDDGSGNLDGLRELAAAMNPGCLRLLNLTNTGLSGVPDFLGTPLGDRVTVGW